MPVDSGGEMLFHSYNVSAGFIKQTSHDFVMIYGQTMGCEVSKE